MSEKLRVKSEKFFCFVICFILFILPCMSFATSYDDIFYWEDTIPTVSQINNMVELKLDAESAILMDQDSGTILYTKNEHEKLRPASVTKVMTILLIMEALDRGEIHLNDKVPCSTRAREMGGSQIWLNETEELTVDEMLKAICVVSANDCCVAMSEFLCGSEEAFVQRMNKRAKELGMNDTTFKNCHGIDEEGHLTTSYDIAIMSRELSKNHPKIHEYTTIWMDTLRDGKSELVNTNKLVRFYSGCTGLKTGSTSLAMFNITATATRNDLNLIAVVMKGSTSQNRFDDAKKLLDYGFANFSNKVIIKKGSTGETITLSKAKKEQIDIIAENDLSVLLKKGDENKVRTEVVLNENIKAPLEYLDVVGKEVCYIDDNIVGEVNLVTNDKIEKKSIIDFMKEIYKYGYHFGKEN